nr:IRON MAN 3 [Lotus japonicus]
MGLHIQTNLLHNEGVAYYDQELCVYQHVTRRFEGDGDDGDDDDDGGYDYAPAA